MDNTKPDLKPEDWERTFDAIPDLIAILDRDHRIVRANKAMAQQLGVSPQKAIGLKCYECVHCANVPPKNCPHAQLLKDGKEHTSEIYEPRLGGEFIVSATPLRNGEGEVIGSIHVARNITQRKQAEEDLKRSEEKYRNLFTNMIDGFAYCQMLYDANDKPIDWIYLDVNSAFEKLTHLKRESVVGKKVSKAIPGTLEAHPELVQIYGRVASTGKNERFEIYFKPLNTWFSISVYSERKGYFIAVFEDVTQRKQVEEALMKSEQRWSTTLSSIGDAVIATDTEGRVSFMNPVAEELTGWALSEAKQKPIEQIFNIINEQTKMIVESPVKKVLEKGYVVGLANHTLLVCKDGTEVPIDDSGAPIIGDGGEITGVVLVFRDITERKKAEEATRQSEERFSRAFHNNPAAMTISRLRDGKWVDVNDSFLKLTGFSREEVVGHNSAELHMFDGGLAERAKIVQNLVTNGVLSNVELGARTKSGKHLDLLFSGVIVMLNGEKYAVASQIDITERKRAEENLRKLNRTLRAISNSNQALMRATDETSFLKEACRIIVEDCGYKLVWVGLKENDKSKSVRPVAHAGFDDGYLETLNITWADTARGQGPTGKAVRTGKPQFCENMTTDAQFMPWREEAIKRGYASSVALPLKSDNEVFGALTLYSKEPNVCSENEIKLLTELAGDFSHGIMMLRLHAEQAIAEAKISRQAALIDLSPDAIIVRKMDGTITFWSKGAEKLYGWTQQEALGKSTTELFRTKFSEPFKDITAELKSKKAWSGELIHNTKDGREVIVQSWWLAEQTEHSKITSILESNVDLTERKKAEREIARLASFPTLNPAPVVEVDQRGKVTYANPATRTLFPTLETEGLHHIFFTNWGSVKQAFLKNDVNSFGREIKIDNHWYHQSFYLVPYTQQIRVYATDIDELKQTEEARAKAQTKLEENAVMLEEYASQMEELAEQRAQQLQNAERLAAIGQTAGMVGHDIRNPLQAITGDMYLIAEEVKEMKDGTSKEAIAESIESVNRNLIYINKIVSDLQDYTRPLKPNLQNANVAELVEGTLLTIAIPKGIEVTTEVTEKAKPINTDVAYMRRILQNLVTNAVQAMQEEGKLSIRASKKKDKVVIIVEDTGVGIPDEVKAKMFTPLFTTKSKGQGLGLAVVKRLVEALGGTIEFDSIAGKGTKFSVELPQKQ